MDTSNIQYTELKTLIDQISQSKSKDEAKYKHIKSICKKSDRFVEITFNLLMKKLPRRNDQLQMLPLFNELFVRSHCFRELFILHINEFISLTLETKKPPDTKVKSMIRKYINEWDEKFGFKYPRFADAIKFIRQDKKLKLEDVRIEEEFELVIQNVAAYNKEQRIKKISKKFNDIQKDIEISLVEIENAVQLLVPYHDCFRRTSDLTKQTNGSDADLPAIDIATRFESELISRTANGSELETQDYSSGSHVMVEQASELQTSSCDENGKKVNMKREEVLNKKNEEKQEKEIELEKKEMQELKKDDFEKEDNDELYEYSKRAAASSPSSHREIVITVETSAKINIGVTPDNRIIIDALCDRIHLISSRYLFRVNSLYQKAMKLNADVTLTSKLRKCRKLMMSVLTRVNRVTVNNRSWRSHRLYRERNSMRRKRKAPTDNSSDDEKDFVEVPDVEMFPLLFSEHRVPDALVAPRLTSPPSGARRPVGLTTPPAGELTAGSANGQTPSSPERRDAGQMTVEIDSHRYHWTGLVRQRTDDPTTGQRPLSPGTLRRLKEFEKRESATDRISMTVSPNPSTATTISTPTAVTESSAPVVPYGPDLVNWGQYIDKSQVNLPRFDISHRFWNRDDHEMAAPEVETRRLIDFAGHFTPITRTCRAPLQGKKELCSRKDKYKCPFHGTIIDRNSDGIPKNMTEIASTSKINTLEKNYWDEKFYDQDGKEIIKPNKKKKKNKTPRSRLKKKIFNKQTMKRVNDKLASSERKKFHDKFGNSFNYSYD